MTSHTLGLMLDTLGGSVALKESRVSVRDEKILIRQIDGLAYEAVFGDAERKAVARWLIWEVAQELGIHPASIHDFYLARGRGEVTGLLTVPALNLRMLAYDSARAAFRAARSLDALALIFEISRSEIGYADQRPAEYASAVIAAAIKEGFRGPLFIQGDHFQAGAKKYAASPESEVKTIRDLILEAIEAGFYNIDIDTSTLVDLSKPTLDEQQKVNYGLCAEFTRFIREHEPKGVTVSIGGEIGEVGLKNSSPEELDAFMRGYSSMKGETAGISKISIQTGTHHGGVVLPDGSLAKVAIDFDVLRTMSEKARRDYGLGGAVQHGASTLPETLFHKFAEAGTCEVHLATAYMTQTIEHQATPDALRNEMYDWVRANVADERKPTDTDAQFIYKTRKKSIGPFKKQFWSLPDQAKAAIGASLEKTFAFIFGQLRIGGTSDLVKRFVKAPEIHKPMPAGGTKGVKGENVDGLAD